MRSVGNAVGAGLGAILGGGFMLIMMGISASALIMILFFTGKFILLLNSIMPFIVKIIQFGLFISIFVASPLIIFQNTRQVSSFIFMSTAWIVGISIWISSVITIYMLWGKLATIVSILMLPFIVPVAVLAVLIKGEWAILGSFALAVIFWLALVGGSSLASSLYEKRLLRA